MIIAIDGPSAAGKGTLARKLAIHFGFAHLDTGALYRAVALRVLNIEGDPTDKDIASKAATQLSPADLDAPGLRDEQTGNVASEIAAIPEVRDALIDFQRRFAAQPPNEAKGAILEGRDIGTVICPNADLKLFLTASLEARAHRRFTELQSRGDHFSEPEILSDLRARDERDMSRSTSPLRQASDAHLLDTTNLSIDSVFAHVSELVNARRT